jgi:diaminopimelate decarboxylase
MIYKQLNTPSFIICENTLNKNLVELNQALLATWGNYSIGYSYKTNSLPWIIDFMNKKGCYAEVVSNVEFELALKCGNLYKNIIFNGPNKGKSHFLKAIEEGSIVNIDSWNEIKWLEELSLTSDIGIGIRVNFDLEKECPSETVMGDEGGRFGFSYENGDLKKIIDQINSMNHIKVNGIHLHNSSKTRSIKIYEAIARKACEIANLFDYELDFINVGGGFFGGLPDKPTFLEYMQAISTVLHNRFSSTHTKLIVEPGASLIASPISFLCEVIDVKDTTKKRIVTVNGSRNNIDPFMNKTNYFLDLLVQSENRNEIKEQVVCGYTCMEHDRLIKLEGKKELVTGDRLLFNNVGSYTMCFSPLFIEYFPIVYVKKENTFTVVREAWGIEEYCQKSIISKKNNL